MAVETDYCALAIGYCEDVLSGQIQACEWVRLACQRHLNDLRRSKAGELPYVWDRDAANFACTFIEQLPHVEGKWESPTIELREWQCFIVTSVFGWVHRITGLRRFRKALIVIPRKCGKSTLLAAIQLYALTMLGEPGAQVVSAATTRDQAKISWGVAHRMVQRMPELRELTGVVAMAHSITMPDGSSFKPLSRDADSLEGLNISFAGIDELHAHPNREVFDVIDEATGARREPLLFIISTEGDQVEGVFAEQVKYLQDVLAGIHQDETYFGVYYTIDKEDDWTLESSWQKANPNYGVSVFPADVQARCAQAVRNAQSQASFLTKRLNVRVGAANAYFNMLAWRDLCFIDGLVTTDLEGQPCVFTIDMASKSDLTSKVLLFRAKETRGKIRAGHLYAFTRSYLPDEATKPGKPNYDIYLGWIAKDAIEVTGGNVTDYEFLERDLLADVKLYRPSSVGIDPNYNAAQFSTRMQAAGIPMVDVAHNVSNFTNAMKDLAADIVSGRIHHNGDPVLAWAMGNVVAKVDAKDNHYPMKTHESNKIDPAVALIAAKSLQLRIVERVSVYASGAGM